jgi:hypothetical protein
MSSRVVICILKSMNQAFVQWELVLEDKKRLVLNAPFAVFFFHLDHQCRCVYRCEHHGNLEKGLHNTWWAAINYLSLRNSVHGGDDTLRVIFLEAMKKWIC